MDPFKMLLDILRPFVNSETALQGELERLRARFELVPRAEYENHMTQLASLQTEVHALERRLAELE